MKRILFVDDEASTLEGLEKLLEPKRAEWTMTFVTSAEAALAKLETSSIDVVVTDLRMPRMDGATLLKIVQTRFPEAVRIILAGKAEGELLYRTVPTAHQYVTKPYAADALINVIARAMDLNDLLRDDVMRKTIGAIGGLPSVPSSYLELMRALENESVSVKEIARIIEKDVAMCAKILQLVNSAFFGLARRTTNIEKAITHIGMNMVRNLVLSIETFRTFDFDDALMGFSVTSLQNHSFMVANMATRLLADRKPAEDAFTASILHDVGKLIFASRLPEHFARVLTATRTLGRSMHVIETDLVGVTHAEVGAYLLGLWGLPYAVVEAVASHHAPSRVPHREFDVVDAVYVANLLTEEQAQPLDDGELDMDHLAALGVADRLPSWRNLAAKIAESAAAF